MRGREGEKEMQRVQNLRPLAERCFAHWRGPFEVPRDKHFLSSQIGLQLNVCRNFLPLLFGERKHLTIARPAEARFLSNRQPPHRLNAKIAASETTKVVKGNSTDFNSSIDEFST